MKSILLLYFITLCVVIAHNVKLVFVPELVSLILIAYTTVKYKTFNKYYFLFFIYYTMLLILEIHLFMLNAC